MENDKNKRTGRERRYILLAVIFIALAALRIFLAANANLYVLGDSEYDDYLGVKQAASILSGNWLGPYNNMTLIKGISFPLLLAALNLLHIPYAVGLGFVMVLSCVPIVPALKRKFGIIPASALSLLILYSPIGFNDRVAMRIYRNAITPWLVVLILTALIAIFLRRDDPVRTWIPWTILSAVSLCFFWNLREDSIWILPLIGGFLALTTLYLLFWRRPGGEVFVAAIALLLVPMLALGLTQGTIAKKNQSAYGIKVVNDRSGSSFAACMGLLLRIEDNLPHDDRVWISRNMMEMAEEASPTLKSIHSELWVTWDQWSLPDIHEIHGDYPQWALRSAAALAGHYRDAAETEAFFAQIAAELQEAFSENRLPKDKAFHLSSQSRGLTPKDLPRLLRESLHNLKNLLSFRYAGVEWPTYAVGNDDNLSLFHEITDCVLIKTEEDAAEHKEMRIVSIISNGLVSVFRILWIPTMVLTAASLLLLVYALFAHCQIKNFSPGFALVVLLGIFLSAFAGIAAVTLFCEYRMNDYVDYFYLGGQMPLLLAGELGSIFSGGIILRKIFSR